MSMCGGLDQGGPTHEEFERNVIQYSEVRTSNSSHSIGHLTHWRHSQSNILVTQIDMYIEEQRIKKTSAIRGQFETVKWIGRKEKGQLRIA